MAALTFPGPGVTLLVDIFHATEVTIVPKFKQIYFKPQSGNRKEAVIGRTMRQL